MLFSFRNDGSEFGGSIYQRVSSEFETGVSLSWTAGTNATRFGLGAKYTPDKETTFRVSVIFTKLISMHFCKL